MPVLGIDYGTKKIGLARSDDTTNLALPLEVVPNTSLTAVLDRIKSVCQAHQIDRVVIGVPISLKAEQRQTFWRQKDLQNEQMKTVLRFVEWLQANLDLPIEVEDERLSTKQANRMGAKGDDDAVAAMLILQTYLDKQSKS